MKNTSKTRNFIPNTEITITRKSLYFHVCGNIGFLTVRGDRIAACDYVGIVSGSKVTDKLSKCGFTVTKSDKVNAPVIDQLPVTIECRVIELQEEFKETRVVADIVGLKADEEVLTDGKVDLGKVGLVVFDTVGLCYRTIGDSVGAAWGVGKKFAE